MHKKQQTPKTVILDFIRHGEPQGGTMYRGSQNDPLSTMGWQQLQSSTEQAIQQGAQWQEIITSPMLRCSKFAEALSQQHNLPLSTAQNLRELCFGDLEGLTPKQAWAQYPTLLAAMWKNPNGHTPPNGEPFNEFCDRVEHSITDIIQQQLSKPCNAISPSSIKNSTTDHNVSPGASPHLLLVVHGGVIRAILHRLLNIPASATFQFDVPFAAITRMVAYADTPSVTGQNGSFTVSLKNLNGISPISPAVEKPTSTPDS
ncbi:MAG: histidine phosphatase family protein [Pseudomonadales bacterium]|nr:histidine phosphatase family protein [Pseudomonadales bacterium]